MKAPLVISDDTDCRCILLEAGMLGELNPTDGFNVATTTFQHGGYFWLASNHTGNPDPRDNGYALIGLPEEFGEEEARKFFAECIAEQASISTALRVDELPPIAVN